MTRARAPRRATRAGARLLALAALTLALGMLASRAAHARDRGVFSDPEDGKFDASEWLLDRKGFLPVPLIITEPAVGYGGGVAVLFFRESIRERVEANHVTPPDIYGGMGAATENGTWFGGGGGMFSFQHDNWRYRGGVMATHLNLGFYGVDVIGDTPKLDYTLDGWASSQQALRRIGATNGYFALRWIYLDQKSHFDQPSLPLPLSDGTRRRSSGIGPSFEYDTRDNTFTPSRNWLGAVDALFYGPAIGSDKTFQTYRARAFGYVPFDSVRFVLGLRADYRTARGDVPFYQLPYIELRGIPAARFQGENTGVVETELRWNVTPRWALIGFVGDGRAWGGQASFDDATDRTAAGGGFRYLLARRLGMYTGVDVGAGPEQSAIYLQFGSAWR